MSFTLCFRTNIEQQLTSAITKLIDKLKEVKAFITHVSAQQNFKFRASVFYKIYFVIFQLCAYTIVSYHCKI